MIAYDLDDYDIRRLMIDHRFQKNLFRIQAVNRVNEILRNRGKLKEVRKSVIFQNNGPKSLCEKIGSKEIREVIEYKEDGSPFEIVIFFH